MVHMCTKFEVSSLNRSRDMKILELEEEQEQEQEQEHAPSPLPNWICGCSQKQYTSAWQRLVTAMDAQNPLLSLIWAPPVDNVIKRDFTALYNSTTVELYLLMILS